MLNKLTDYHDFNQPDTDYETFDVNNNENVILNVRYLNLYIEY